MLRQTTKRAFLGLASRNSTPFSVVSRLYHPNVIDHYDNPRNVGSFDKSDPNVGTGLVGAPQCGDVMKLQVKFDGSGLLVKSLMLNSKPLVVVPPLQLPRSVFTSLSTEWVKGKSVEEVLTIKNSKIAKHLSLPPVKLHCSMLAEDAIKAAVKNYKEKQAEANGETVEA
ncbi:NIF system FeS cluster assembly NifU N-terminal [Arabidopsis suecica]|uniref:NIF system FeS cluster assembly NifU N-terminal n=1 Tax=Arabidopsis suecica TaxID=45249 RepID=A0A8T1ZHZ4_ARASU|nr:NIF system FeS cluster assembly NifU N-terminal [Arabidopsis suecica]